MHRPETHTTRQATQHGCLPSFLGGGDKGIQRVYGEEKNILHQADRSSQGRTKISCTNRTSPTNQTRKDFFHLYSLSPHLPQLQQSAGSAPLPPSSLCEVDASVKKATRHHRTRLLVKRPVGHWPLATIPYLYKWPVSTCSGLVSDAW